MFRARTHILYDLLTNFSRHRRKSKCLCRIQKYSSEKTSYKEKPFSFGNRYTEEEKNLILKTINDSTLDELKGYNMTEGRLKKLAAYRDKNGSFETLDQVFLLQGIDISVLDKFCKSITKKSKPSKSRSLNAKGDLLIPPMDDNARKAIDTCTGIWVCGNLISWAQLDTGCNLLKWDCQNLGELTMKDGLVVIVDSVARIVSKVPASHAYIMETDPIIPFTRMNSTAYYLQLQRQQIVATIATLLGTRPNFVHEVSKNHEHDDENDESDENGENGENDENSESVKVIKNVYMMRSRAAARYFDLLIGSEIVSSQEVVRRILEADCDVEDDRTIFIRALPEVRKFYDSHDVYQREQMNWSLLLATTFLNLSIMRNVNSK